MSLTHSELIEPPTTTISFWDDWVVTRLHECVTLPPPGSGCPVVHSWSPSLSMCKSPCEGQHFCPGIEEILVVAGMVDKETRFRPNRVAADMEVNGEFDF